MFYNGRSVAIESMHGGIEPSIIAAKLAHADIAGRVAELRKTYQGRYVFVGIDKVTSTYSRIPSRTVAYTEHVCRWQGQPSVPSCSS